MFKGTHFTPMMAEHIYTVIYLLSIAQSRESYTLTTHRQIPETSVDLEWMCTK